MKDIQVTYQRLGRAAALKTAQLMCTLVELSSSELPFAEVLGLMRLKSSLL